MKKNYYLWVIFFIFLSTYNFYGKQDYNFKFLTIKDIEVVGSNNSDQKKIISEFNKIIGKNLIYFNKKDLKKFKKIDFVNSYEIRKIYPNKVIVKVIEDKPIGIFINENNEEYLILENNKKLKKLKTFNFLPKVYGINAHENFFSFYQNIKKSKINLNLIKQYKYYEINRWDIFLNDGRIIKLPPENFINSLDKFSEINEKSEFSKFKIFDFRVKNELILKQ